LPGDGEELWTAKQLQRQPTSDPASVTEGNEVVVHVLGYPRVAEQAGRVKDSHRVTGDQAAVVSSLKNASVAAYETKPDWLELRVSKAPAK
jgi:hypothetical protein